MGIPTAFRLTFTTTALCGLALSGLAPPAHADGVGLRVGGYGFRQAPTDHHAQTGWNDCRMNGVGLFGDVGFARHWFAEAGVDAYFADDFPTGGHEHDPGAPEREAGMDRVSTLATVAGGFRAWPTSRVSPYLQVGTGLEITRVTVPGLGLEESFLLPVGFFGVGGDVRVGHHVRLGMNVRFHAMGHFDHGPGVTALEPEAELSAQGQFYVHYSP